MCRLLWSILLCVAQRTLSNKLASRQPVNDQFQISNFKFEIPVNAATTNYKPQTTNLLNLTISHPGLLRVSRLSSRLRDPTRSFCRSYRTVLPYEQKWLPGNLL